MFRVSQYPSSGVLKTVTAASGTGHNTATDTYLQRGLQFLVLLMMGVVTPKTCSDFAVNKYLHTVEPGWIFINIQLRCTVICLAFRSLAPISTGTCVSADYEVGN